MSRSLHQPVVCRPVPLGEVHIARQNPSICILVRYLLLAAIFLLILGNAGLQLAVRIVRLLTVPGDASGFHPVRLRLILEQLLKR